MGNTQFEDAYIVSKTIKGEYDQSTVAKVIRNIEKSIDTNDKVWVGMSGDGDQGLRKRWNSKYRDGFNALIVVYETSNIEDCRNMERALIAELGKDKIFNKSKGGEGNTGKKQPFLSIYCLE